MPESCPYCGAVAESLHDEIAHMTAQHADVIAQRFDSVGLSTDKERVAATMMLMDASWLYILVPSEVSNAYAREHDAFARPARASELARRVWRKFFSTEEGQRWLRERSEPPRGGRAVYE